MSQPANTSSKDSSPITNPEPTPSLSQLELLPAEMKIEILSHLESLSEVRSLALASPSYNAVFRLNRTRILETMLQLNICKELLARGGHDLLNPHPFDCFDLIVPKEAKVPEYAIISAVQNLFLQARKGGQLMISAYNRDALREVVAAAGEKKNNGRMGTANDMRSSNPERRWRAKTALPYGVYDPEQHTLVTVWDKGYFYGVRRGGWSWMW
ncbi:MAG: hypothetical protein Q9195_009497 [Heterodermia aff. obscurata]